MSEDRPAPSVWRRLFNGWMAVAARFGHVQTLMLLVVVYGMLFGPVGIGISVLRLDMLSKRGLGQDGSAWMDADSAAPDLERAKLAS